MCYNSPTSHRQWQPPLLASRQSELSQIKKTSLATKEGHLNQERKYLHPTKAQEPFNVNEDIQPGKITTITNCIFLQVYQPVHDNNPHQQKVYMNLTERFPHKSSRGKS